MFKLVYGHDSEVHAQMVMKKIQYLHNLLNIYCHFWAASVQVHKSYTEFPTKEM
jgi:hypothetical protein